MNGFRKPMNGFKKPMNVLEEFFMTHPFKRSLTAMQRKWEGNQRSVRTS